MRTLSGLDVYAPYPRVRQSTRPSQLWYDAECRAARRTTRSLERRYRRRPSAESFDAWKASSRINVISSTVKLKITGLVHLLNIVIIQFVELARRANFIV